MERLVQKTFPRVFINRRKRIIPTSPPRITLFSKYWYVLVHLVHWYTSYTQGYRGLIYLTVLDVLDSHFLGTFTSFHEIRPIDHEDIRTLTFWSFGSYLTVLLVQVVLTVTFLKCSQKLAVDLFPVEHDTLGTSHRPGPRPRAPRLHATPRANFYFVRLPTKKRRLCRRGPVTYTRPTL